METVINIICLMVAVIMTASVIFIWRFDDAVKDTMKAIKEAKENSPEIIPGRPMSYDECNEVLFGVIQDIFKNKYELYFTLKEVSIIPNMDEEIENMAKEVLAAFSPTQLNEFNRYYSKEYIGQLVVRQTQILFMDYTRKNKPNVG